MTELQKESLYATFKLLPLGKVEPSLFSTFSCKINSDLTNFIRSTATNFENRQIARAFVLLNNDESEVVGYFTISMKSLSTNGMSKTSIKKIDGVSNSRVCIHSFLIGQLGISDNYAKYKLGTLLLDDAFLKIEMAHDLVAGRYVLVDAVNHEKVIKFYKEAGFALLDTNLEESENGSIRMIYKI
jgi:predicted GNAT family N-acyltransferase